MITTKQKHLCLEKSGKRSWKLGKTVTGTGPRARA